MKYLSITVFVLFLFFLNISMNAQDENSLFRKNTSFYKFNQKFLVGRYNWTENNESDGTENLADVNLEMTYFPSDNFGVGMNIMVDRNIYEYDHLSDAYHSYMFYVHGLYGQTINDDLNLYTKLKVGVGAEIFDTEYSGGTTDSEVYNRFGWGIEVGSPVKLSRSSYFYFTPAVSFRSLYTNFEGGSENRLGLYLNGSFDIALGCEQYLCDLENDFAHSTGKYRQGNLFLGASYISAGFGKEKTEYEGDPGSGVSNDEDNFTRGKLGVNGLYYFIDNVAAGLDIGLYRTSRSEVDSDFTQSTFNLSFSPKIIANLPYEGAWNNLYGQLGGTYGIYNQGYENGSSSEYKEGYFSVFGGVGYNIFFTNDLAFSFSLLYDYTKFAEEEGENEWSQSGPEVQIGLIKHLFSF